MLSYNIKKINDIPFKRLPSFFSKILHIQKKDKYVLIEEDFQILTLPFTKKHFPTVKQKNVIQQFHFLILPNLI